MSIILSIGYERRSIIEFIHLLAENGVEQVLDIRETPISRKPGFSKKKLNEHLNQVGIGYVHLPQAGNPYHKDKKDLAQCLQLYRQYLETNPEVVEAVQKECAGKAVAVLCYERKHENCHRSVLLEFAFPPSATVQLVKME
jgi:uncharacterized protein (DUF488 family)